MNTPIPRRATIIRQDGRLLTGREWIKPTDYQTEEIANDQLPSLKGATPLELPGADDQTDRAGPDT